MGRKKNVVKLKSFKQILDEYKPKTINEINVLLAREGYRNATAHKIYKKGFCQGIKIRLIISDQVTFWYPPKKGEYCVW